MEEIHCCAVISVMFRRRYVAGTVVVVEQVLFGFAHGCYIKLSILYFRVHIFVLQYGC